jgi:hypothetical protein
MKNRFKANTFIVGVQKAGTTSLFDWLGQHPQILAPEEMKDYNFFGSDTVYSRGEEWFMNSFATNSAPKKVVHGYVCYSFIGEKALKRIKDFCPQPKLIMVLRNPADRAYSAYWEYRKTCKENRKNFDHIAINDIELLSKGDSGPVIPYLEMGLYSQQLELIYSIFDKEQVKIVIFEDLVSKKLETIQDIYKFLEVSEFEPEFNYVNESGLPRSKFIQKLLQRLTLPEFIKKRVSGKALTKIKSNLIRKVNVKKVKYPPLEESTRSELTMFYQDDIKQLEGLTNLNLDSWKK